MAAARMQTVYGGRIILLCICTILLAGNSDPVKLSEYELQKKYFELINDIASDDNLLSMYSERVIHR